MIKQFSYKQRFYISVVLVFIACIAIYFITIKRTVQLAKDHNEMKNELVNYSSTIEKIASLKKDINMLENRIVRVNSNGNDMQNKIVKNVALYCEQHGILIKGVTVPKVGQGESINMLETRVITVKGEYFEILKLAYNVEQKYGIGRISSLHFFTQKSKESKMELYANIYLQNIVGRKIDGRNGKGS